MNCTDHSLLLGYLGPGGAFSALGGLIALLLAVLLALAGFVWYPIKRLLAKRGRSRDEAAPSTAGTGPGTQIAAGPPEPGT